MTIVGWSVGPLVIPGQPRPQGSKRALVRGKRAVMIESSPHVGNWRADVREAVRRAWPPVAFPECPVVVQATFAFLRPASHYVGGDRSRPLREDAPYWCTSHRVGDLDKLQRAVGDALTGIAWNDDANIVRWDARKVWSDRPSLTITVSSAPQEAPA